MKRRPPVSRFLSVTLLLHTGRRSQPRLARRIRDRLCFTAGRYALSLEYRFRYLGETAMGAALTAPIALYRGDRNLGVVYGRFPRPLWPCPPDPDRPPRLFLGRYQSALGFL